MAAGVYDILIEQGATFLMTLTFKGSDGETLDLTDLSFRGKIKKAFTDTTAQAEFTFNVLDQGMDETKGKVEVTLDAAITAALDAPAKKNTRTLTTMVYDIESEDLEGVVVRWLQGDARVSPEVTK